jgi:trans-aconitate 2-methyltransferase
MKETQWNTQLYENNHGFVWQYGESLLELLAPQAGELILDLGCGTGHLTAKIANYGSKVWGFDADIAMISQAQQNYLHLQFQVADARNFQLESPLDAVFSNAVLHWIPEAEQVINQVYQALKPGSRFVAEFGGKGNVQKISEALFSTLADLGYADLLSANPWYFPSLAEYAICLEQQRFEVTYAILFSRPTALTGEQGLANWLRMFASVILSKFSHQEQQEIITQIEAKLKPVLFQDNCWFADYRRLRILALKR